MSNNHKIFLGEFPKEETVEFGKEIRFHYWIEIEHECLNPMVKYWGHPREKPTCPYCEREL